MVNRVTMDVVSGVDVDSTGLIVNTSKAGTGARSNIGVNSGKVYFEVNTSGYINIGLCDETNNLDSISYHNDSSFAVQFGWLASTRFYIGKTLYAYTNPININSFEPNIIAFALDMDNYVVDVYLNGILIMDSFILKGKVTNLGITLYPFLFVGGGNYAGHSEWNFGATPFKYSIPEGFRPYNDCVVNKRYVLKDDEGYKNLTEFISTVFPTEEQFKEKGMRDIPPYSQLSTFNDLVTYTTDHLSKSLVKFQPKGKTVLSSGAIDFSGKELKKVSLIGADNVSVLFSKDRGVTWYGNIKQVKGKIPIISATSHSPHYSNQTPDRTIDGIKNNFWQVFGKSVPIGQTGHELILDVGKSVVLDSASITAGTVYSKGSMGVKNFEVYGATNDAIIRELLYSGIAPDSPDTATKEILFMINSKKGYRYYIFNFKESYVGKNYVVVNEIELFGSSVVSSSISLSDISIQGLTPTQLTAITLEEWQAFLGGSSSLRFAYYLPDETANTDKLELTVDLL